MKAVFIDKDGTLIEDVPYNVDTSWIKLYPQVGKSLALLQQQGYRLFIVSNQPGIAKEYFNITQLEMAFAKVESLLDVYNATIEHVYYCPHGIEEHCNCRKPKPGLLLQAAGEFGIDMRASWMIGDILNDVEAGNRAGCKSILVDVGNETEWLGGDMRKPFAITTNIADAVNVIITTDQRLI
jgi:D-glycero-D-manno-heptose 1,7-bisphosphate phosphatase